jgi:hypothetical protein
LNPSVQIRLLTARVRELEEAARTSASGEMAVTSAPALSAANSDLNAAVTLLTARCDRLQATLDQERADHEAATASAAAAAVVARADSVAAVQATAVLRYVALAVYVSERESSRIGVCLCVEKVEAGQTAA